MENMKALGHFEDVLNLPNGLKTLLCDSIKDLISVEKELKENSSKKYEYIVQNLVIYNPFQPHYSSPDVISSFSDKGNKNTSLLQKTHVNSCLFQNLS